MGKVFEPTIKEKLFNQISDSNDTSETIIDIFEEKAEIFKENTAIIFKEITISYKILNEKSNQLAHYIKSNFEINQSDFIAIYLDRSVEMLISILAVLKLGKAYVPIDPLFPDESVQRFLAESDPQYAVCADLPRVT